MEITPNSWIVMQADNKEALLVQTADKIMWIANNEVKFFSSQEDLEKALNAAFEIYQPVVPQDQIEKVGPYTCKHTPIYFPQELPVPSYSKNENNKVRYAAGYWAFRYTTGWQMAWCPKIATLNELEYAGPFTHKMEAQHFITNKNKKESNL